MTTPRWLQCLCVTAVCTVFLACTTTMPNPAFEDTGTPVQDSGVPDTKPPADSAPPGPITCEQKLDKSFACVEPTVKAGKTVCTDLMIQEFMNCFGTTGDSKKCTAAQTKYPACNTCILKDWLTAAGRIDTASCYKAVDPTGTCGKTMACTNDCLDLVCPADDCDDTAGSGSTATRSQLDDCYRSAQQKPGSTVRPTGQCWDVAVKDYAACTADAKFAYCNVRAASDLLYFYRGACRDNANWAKAELSDGSEDAGVTETGTDTGAATDTADAG